MRKPRRGVHERGMRMRYVRVMATVPLMTTFGDINGKPEPTASADEIRHLLWKIDSTDRLGKEPPPEETESGGIDRAARERRAALDDAVRDDKSRSGLYDSGYPYHALHTNYDVDELRVYAAPPSERK